MILLPFLRNSNVVQALTAIPLSSSLFAACLCLMLTSTNLGSATLKEFNFQGVWPCCNFWTCHAHREWKFPETYT